MASGTSTPRDDSKEQPTSDAAPLYDQKTAAAEAAVAAATPQEDSTSNLLADGRLLRSTALSRAEVELGVVPKAGAEPSMAASTGNHKLRMTDQSAYLDASVPPAAEPPMVSCRKGEDASLPFADDSAAPISILQNLTKVVGMETVVKSLLLAESGDDSKGSQAEVEAKVARGRRPPATTLLQDTRARDLI